jgi:hypothetical protein
VALGQRDTRNTFAWLALVVAPMPIRFLSLAVSVRGLPWRLPWRARWCRRRLAALYANVLMATEVRLTATAGTDLSLGVMTRLVPVLRLDLAVYCAYPGNSFECGILVWPGTRFIRFVQTSTLLSLASLGI